MPANTRYEGEAKELRLLKSGPQRSTKIAKVSVGWRLLLRKFKFFMGQTYEVY
jgi:hypothetical protein